MGVSYPPPATILKWEPAESFGGSIEAAAVSGSDPFAWAIDKNFLYLQGGIKGTAQVLANKEIAKLPVVARPKGSLLILIAQPATETRQLAAIIKSNGEIVPNEGTGSFGLATMERGLVFSNMIRLS